MTDQVKQQRKVFHLLSCLHDSISMLILTYNPKDECISAIIKRIDQIKGDVNMTRKQDIDPSLIV